MIVLIGFIAGIALGYSWHAGVFSFTRDSEKSYSTGGKESRYLREFKRTTQVLPTDTSAIVGVTTEQITALTDSLNRSGTAAQTFSWFNTIQNEHILLAVTDLGNLPFTLDISDGRFQIEQGFDVTSQPTLVIPLDSQNIQNLETIFSDGQLTYEEQYRIYYILAIPALRALYATDALFFPGDKTRLKFDDLVQLEIPATEPIYYKGVPVIIQATAVNVDGQWLVMPGLHGDPDWKIALSLDSATKLYTLGVYEVRAAGSNPLQLNTISQQFLKLMDESLVYTRSDHL
ncbi:MAG: hypothetical protein HY565_04880 [Candidatus Kerfeldbacteria bacterium]|nr:hypothetical protein [Candidatus Kerfeldbacteria bacterium]